MSLSLPRGCRIGALSVHPANWEEPGADTSIPWYIHYRFHDPVFTGEYKKGYPVQLRGMNGVKNLTERRRITRSLIENEKRLLEQGYNPILKRVVFTETNELEISPNTPFPLALKKAYNLVPEIRIKKEIRKALVHIELALQQLGYGDLKISEVRRRHIKSILTKISLNRKAATGKEWGAPSYNHYRSYLDILFNQLDEAEANEVDPVSKVKKKRTTRRIRKVLTPEEVERIDDQVKANQYSLWRFIHLFFHSGARMSELMRVQRKQVDLAHQQFLVTMRKGGGEIEEVWKTITKAAMPLWEEILREGRLEGPVQRGSGGRGCCLLPAPGTRPDPEDYLFSRELRVGTAPISERQVTIRWARHIKKKLDIEADFYSLKHKNTTEIVSQVMKKLDEATLAAAERNSHKDGKMVKENYDVQRAEREHEALKILDIQLN